MSKQSLTIEVDVPNGYELTGEYRVPTRFDVVEHQGCVVNGWGSSTPRPILRKSWVAPSWLPEGCWVYKARFSESWRACREQPKPAGPAYKDRYIGHKWVVVDQLACLNGEAFNPPTHSTCVQVKH